MGKSFKKSKEYDVQIFARRDIETAIIQSFIKRIGSCAFQNCTQLKKIEFSTDSQLKIFDKFAFSYSSIDRITIPSHLALINYGAFKCCKKLQLIEVPDNSDLQTIESLVFVNASIKSFRFPLNLMELKKTGASNLANIDVMLNNKMYSTYNDEFAIGKSSTNQVFYDVLVFVGRDINKEVIPDFITIIDMLLMIA